MLKFKFDPKLDFQIDAINAVVDLFKGQVRKSFNHVFQIVPNVLELDAADILNNLREIQKGNGLEESEQLGELPYNFTIEMETGTGKTYIYLRTLLELNKEYGFTKFIIVVPSVAIKEGVLKTLQITKEHFKGLYDNLPYSYFEYKSDNLVQIRMFAQDTNLQIMVITRDAFNKDINIIHNVHDKMGDRPIQLIKKTKPIVILDEPQKIAGEAAQWGISELNPLCILRYSATHREIINLVYRLSPYDAYNFGLVKKIEVSSITEEGDTSSKKVILEEIESVKAGLRARVKVFVKEKKGIRLKTITMKNGDDLARKTGNPYYEGFHVSEIHKGAGYMLFSNGVKIYKGKSSVDEDEIIRTMVSETVKEHLAKKAELNDKGIKVLSLFFINRVDDYLPKDGWLRKMFEEEFKKAIKKEFQTFKGLNVKESHAGYFSEMRQTQSIEKDEKAYNLIMRDKEKLLSLDEPVEFIFSHSALREGWDNPNVFNICTLSYSTSEIKKRQEIGRGLRLPVNLDGERIQDREINLLTVVTNETYREYVEELQTEFREEAGEEAPPVEDKRMRKKIVLKKDVLKGELFGSLWEKISKKAKYVVDIDTDQFMKKCVKDIDEIDIKAPEISVQKVKLEKIDEESIKEEFVKERKEQIEITSILNVVEYIEKETSLTRATILEIIKGLKNIGLLFNNPQRYAEKAAGIINHNLKTASAENIKYIELDECFDTNLFNEEIMTYDKYIVPLNNKKTIYKIEGENKDTVQGESKIETDFSQELDKDSRIKLFIKLPELYTIETPVGKYTPDWAMVVERRKNGEKTQSIYFVVETKGSTEIQKLRPEEQIKILSAKRRFELMKDVKFLAPIDSFNTLTQQW